MTTDDSLNKTELLDELRSISSSLGAGFGDDKATVEEMLRRIKWGLDHIQRVEAERTAALIEELSKNPATTWGQVKTAVLERAGIMNQ